MTRKRVVERPRGIGTVYQDEHTIAKVRYSLEVGQDPLIANTIGRNSQKGGSIGVNGWLKIEGEARSLDTDELRTLELEDGRRMKFLAQPYDRVAKRYRIVRTDGWLEAW